MILKILKIYALSKIDFLDDSNFYCNALMTFYFKTYPQISSILFYKSSNVRAFPCRKEVIRDKNEVESEEFD